MGGRGAAPDFSRASTRTTNVPREDPCRIPSQHRLNWDPSGVPILMTLYESPTTPCQSDLPTLIAKGALSCRMLTRTHRSRHDALRHERSQGTGYDLFNFHSTTLSQPNNKCLW
jgi:hypothetical protein